ncbi:MAG: hypothetical protein F4Y98_08480 [Chloroflexi bacterium]|nr:hypothetical protein [Chloroflexota bacterium]
MPVPIGRQIIRPNHAVRLAELEREIVRVGGSEGRLVELYTDGRIARAALDRKQDELMLRKGVLERERAQLRAEAEPGPAPELLRERMRTCSGSSASRSRRLTGTN